MELKDLPAWVSAGAAVLSMVGLFLAFRQLRLSRRIAQMQFEDGLSREQIFLRMQARVSTATWGNWCSGIRAMLSRTAFRDMWKEILQYPRHGFDELARLIGDDFNTDPIKWPPLVTASAPNGEETQTGG